MDFAVRLRLEAGSCAPESAHASALVVGILLCEQTNRSKHR